MFFLLDLFLFSLDHVRSMCYLGSKRRLRPGCPTGSEMCNARSPRSGPPDRADRHRSKKGCPKLLPKQHAECLQRSKGSNADSDFAYHDEGMADLNMFLLASLHHQLWDFCHDMGGFPVSPLDGPVVGSSNPWLKQSRVSVAVRKHESWRKMAAFEFAWFVICCGVSSLVL